MRQLLVPLWARFVLVGALVGSLLLALTFAVSAQTETPTPGTTPTSGATTPTPSTTPVSNLPPELAFLHGMSPSQRFDHLSSSQVTFTNPQGQPVVVNMIPGTVSAVTPTSLTIQPNGGGQLRTFNVTQSTYVRGSAHNGTTAAFVNGDRVVVEQIGNSGDASAIYGHNFGSRGGGMMYGHGGAGWGG